MKTGYITASMTILLVPRFIQSSMFDTRWLAWIGIDENPPSSNDFVPFFPWVGLTIIGFGIARLISLPIYLIHQPVLLAIIIPMSWMLNRY